MDGVIKRIKGCFVDSEGKLKKGRLIFLGVLVLLVIYFIVENNILTVREFEVVSNRIPESFSEYKIAQVSDLHNKEFGKNNKRLLKRLEELEPDMILITGDIADSIKTDLEAALDFCKGAVLIAPTYYVNGNHESAIEDYMEFEGSLTKIGVRVLRNQALKIEENGESINLIGIDDPTFTYIGERKLKELIPDDGYSILMSHRPELLEMYAGAGVDLVFTGHAHGGQFRIPFIGGVIAPNQGFFPKYDSGLYSEGNTNMVVSRGLGNSIIPIRVNNEPEIIIVMLKNQ